MSEPYLGQIMLVGFNFAPRGWALCDGQILPINQNQALYSLIGTTYGGDGRTTFALPDLRSRVPLHQGSGPGLDSYTLGEKTGVETVTLTTAQLPSHTHTAYCYSDSADAITPVQKVWASEQSQAFPVYSDQTPDQTMNGNSLTHSGGSLPHTNLQPYIAVYFCIAMQGIFPPRN